MYNTYGNMYQLASTRLNYSYFKGSLRLTDWTMVELGLLVKPTIPGIVREDMGRSWAPTQA